MTKDEILAGESTNIEYKVAVPDKSENYLKTVVGFANGKGGQLIFGIDDKTLNVVGIDKDTIYKTIDAITNTISDACEPVIRPDVALRTIGDKTVIVVEIMPGVQPPYYIKSQGMMNGTYVRVSGTTRHVEPYTLKELILEGQNRYFDSEICPHITISDDDIDALCKNLKEIAINNTWQDSEKTRIKDVTKNTLISWGVLRESEGRVFPTNAFALLTGKMPQMPIIQCGVFKGVTRVHFVDRREFEGSIQEHVEAAYQYVREKINMGMTIKGIYRQDVYELPTDSVREIIANAVVHRSYLEPGNIQVAIFDDRLEVTSPGKLMNNVSIKKIMEGYSKPRNPAIAKAFAYMRIIEQWGTGIPKLYEACQEYGLPNPKLIDLGADVRVNMYRLVDEGLIISENIPQATTQDIEQISNITQVNQEIISDIKTTQAPLDTTQATTQDIEQIGNNTQFVQNATGGIQTTQATLEILSNEEKLVLSLLEKNPKITQQDIAEKLGWKKDRVKYFLNKWKKMGFIKRVGTSQNGFWRVSKKMKLLQKL